MNNQRNAWKFLLLVLAIAVMVVLVTDFNNRTAELHRLNAEKEIQQKKLDSLQATEAYLKAQMAYATSAPAVGKWAYGDGHMVRPGDIPVVPIQPGVVTILPTPTVVVTPTEVSNIETWRVLFFGKSTP